jgi:glycosyltransferase involved in cell wall biosynthesis
MPAKKKILYVNYSLDIGGIETLILELCKNLDRDKYEPAVCVFVPGGKLVKEFHDNGIGVYEIPIKRSGIDCKAPFKLAGLCKAKDIDLIHTHNQTAWLYGATAGMLSRRPIIHTEHTTADYFKYHTRRWEIFEKILSMMTSKITAVAGSVADYMIRNEGIKKEKIKVVYNGIKHSDFDNIIDVEKKKQVLGIENSELIVGNVARLTANKDHLTLLRAFKKVIIKIPTAKLLIAGDGPLKDTLHKNIDELGLNASVFLLGDRRDIPELLQIFDLFVLSSIREGFPVVLLEAMASGLPVVASDVDGNRELVIDKETGIIIKPGRVEEFADAMINILTNKQRSEKMGNKGKMRVVDSFSLQSMINKYESIYASVR